GDRLPSNETKDFVAEMGVVPLERLQITFVEQVEHKEVVALADDLAGDGAWLLCDEYAAESVFPSLLDPANEDVAIVEVAVAEHGLGLLEHREATDGWLRHVRQMPNVVLEAAPQNHAGDREAVLAAEVGHIDDHNAGLAQFLQDVLSQCGSGAVQSSDGGNQVVLDGPEADIVLARLVVEERRDP